MSFPGLHTPLLHIGGEVWTLADAAEGTQIFGGTGSGKTTGSGALLAESFLLHGFGGLVLCAKPTERARWESYARACGREDDLIIFSPNHPWRFNFLDYEYHRGGLGAGQVESIVELFQSLKGMVEGDHTMSQDGGHWDRASSELIRNAIHILALSQGRLSLDDLYHLVTDAPESVEQAQDVAWQRRSFCWQALKIAEQKVSTPRDQHNLRMAKRYWLQTYAGLADKTRSSVYSTFSAIADVMLHDAMWELFCTETNLLPEDTYTKGSIVVVDMPNGKVGILAQRLMKHLYQRAWLRRSVAEHPRPICLFVDEAQAFIDGSFDFMFQSLARDARVATVYITQNINNYYAVLGQKSRDEANALLGNFQTKIFHANSDSVMNQWAAESIGFTQKYRHSWNAGSNEMSSYFSIGASEQRVYKIEPSLFTTLLKGGQNNGWQAETIWFQGGRQWQANGENWLKVSITQAGAPSSAAPALPARNRAAWFIMLLEWLLIFLNRHDAMDVWQAMEWQGDFLSAPRQETIGAAIQATCAQPDPPAEDYLAAPHRLALPLSPLLEGEGRDGVPSRGEGMVSDGKSTK